MRYILLLIIGLSPLYSWAQQAENAATVLPFDLPQKAYKTEKHIPHAPELVKQFLNKSQKQQSFNYDLYLKKRRYNKTYRYKHSA